MEILTLRYFLAVAHEEGINRAAEVLNVTQPTLSRQLQDLEESLGVKLLIRGPRKITLTNEGFLFRRRAEEIL
ncbi:LysR family transcriptional regulator [Treponema sp.]|uniref:LysR family transcriptional regulator n=1 Tax=Treponema sp. TaxID=166 RepID=UPI003FD6CD4F